MPSRNETNRRESRIPGSVAGFTVFGVPVRFHFTFILLAIFVVIVGFQDRRSSVADAIFVVSLFGSVLLHELGHAVVAWRLGVKTLEIVMFPIGGVSRLEKTPPARKELWIAAAGPGVNLVAAAILLGVTFYQNGGISGIEAMVERTDAPLLETIGFANLVLAVFNLLPAFPMDGGRILRSVLALWQPEEQATRIASRAGRLLAIGLGLYGLISMQYLLLFIAFFVYLGAAQEGQAAIGRSLAQGMPVRLAMVTKFHTLSHGNTIGEAARLLLDTSQQDFPVVHGEQVIGLLDRNALLRAMATSGSDIYVAGAMDRDFLRLDPNLDLTEAMEAMANSGPCALVMEGDHLCGLFTRENLSEFLLLRRFGMTPLPRSNVG